MWWFSSRRKDTPPAAPAAPGGDGGSSPPPPASGGASAGAASQPLPSDGLDAVVTGVLQALTDAQQVSNRTSAALAGTYLSDPALSSFKVPNAVIDSVELTLSFAIRKADREMRTESAPPVFRQDTLKSVCDEAARIAGKALADLLRQAQDGHAPTSGKDEAKADDAREEVAQSVTRAAFIDWLGDRMVDAINARRRSLIDSDGMVDTYAVERVLDQVIRSKLADHPEVVELLPDHNPDALKPDIHGVAARLAHATVTPQQTRQKTAMDVIVDADSLAKLPREAIQSITMNVRLRNLSWVADKDGGDHLVIED